MKKYIVALILGSVFFPLAGCGGSSGSSSPAPTSNPTTPPSPTTLSDLSVQVVNLGYTVFAGQTYSSSFTITNTSTTKTYDVSTIHFNASSPATWTTTSNECASVTSFSPGATCTISGDFSLPNSGDHSAISLSVVSSSSTPLLDYTQNTLAVTPNPAPDSYFALRLLNTNPNDTIYVAASENNSSGTNCMIQFDSSGVGTITSQNSDVSPSWGTYAVTLSPSSNNVLYIPISTGGGGKMYISVNNKLSDGGSPNPSGGDVNNNNTQWQEVEFAYVTTATQPFIDITNVNVMSIPLSLNGTVQNAVPVQLTKNAGTTYAESFPMSSVLANVKAALAPWPTTWATLSNYNGSSDQLIRILSPVSLGQPIANAWNHEFAKYINDVWNYYSQPGNNIYVDATEITAFGGPGGATIPTTRCILVGHVTGQNMIFTEDPSSAGCPISSVTGDYNGGGIAGLSPQLQPITKFTASDFLLGAPGAAFTLWGPNKSYRSVIGREIAASQSVGMLPFCSNPNIILNKVNLVANSDLYYTPQYSCLTNYSSYTDSVINQYAKQNSLYFTYYGYAYSDALGEDNTLNIFNADQDPVTLTILKLQ